MYICGMSSWGAQQRRSLLRVELARAAADQQRVSQPKGEKWVVEEATVLIRSTTTTTTKQSRAGL